MQVLKLARRQQGDHGTFGRIELPGGHVIFTAELPDRGNQKQISRILPGEYQCTMAWHRKFGRVYELASVPERSGVLIHNGNLAGDVELGWVSHSYGCILVGEFRGRLGRQEAVLASRVALGKLHEAMEEKPFTLQIVEEWL